MRKNIKKASKILYSVLDYIIIPILLIFILFSCVFLWVYRTENIPQIFGISVFKVETESMSKQTSDGIIIEKGDIAFVKHNGVVPYEKGEIVAFYNSKTVYDKNSDSKRPQIWLHQIVDVKTVDGVCYYQTKGTNNTKVDPEWVHHDNVIGHYRNASVLIKNVFNFITSPKGILLAVFIPNGVLLMILIIQLVFSLSDAMNEKKLVLGTLAINDSQCIKRELLNNLNNKKKIIIYNNSAREQREQYFLALWPNIIKKVENNKKLSNKEAEIFGLIGGTSLEQSISKYQPLPQKNTANNARKKKTLTQDEYFSDSDSEFTMQTTLTGDSYIVGAQAYKKQKRQRGDMGAEEDYSEPIVTIGIENERFETVPKPELYSLASKRNLSLKNAAVINVVELDEEVTVNLLDDSSTKKEESPTVSTNLQKEHKDEIQPITSLTADSKSGKVDKKAIKQAAKAEKETAKEAAKIAKAERAQKAKVDKFREENNLDESIEISTSISDELWQNGVKSKKKVKKSKAKTDFFDVDEVDTDEYFNDKKKESTKSQPISKEELSPILRYKQNLEEIKNNKRFEIIEARSDEELDNVDDVSEILWDKEEKGKYKKEKPAKTVKSEKIVKADKSVKTEKAVKEKKEKVKSKKADVYIPINPDYAIPDITVGNKVTNKGQYVDDLQRDLAETVLPTVEQREYRPIFDDVSQNDGFIKDYTAINYDDDNVSMAKSIDDSQEVSTTLTDSYYSGSIIDSYNMDAQKYSEQEPDADSGGLFGEYLGDDEDGGWEKQRIAAGMEQEEFMKIVSLEFDEDE